MALKIAVNADASSLIGYGHLMRCLALSEGLMDAGHEVLFLTSCPNPMMVERLRGEGIEVMQLDSPGYVEARASGIRRFAPDWAVLDGYGFDSDSHLDIKAHGARLVVIDDYCHLGRYHADIILNQNYGGEHMAYNQAPGVVRLLGPDYVMLRREFLMYPEADRKPRGDAHNVLITFGGTSCAEHFAKALGALGCIDRPLNVKCIIDQTEFSRINPFKDAAACAHDINAVGFVRDMAPLLHWADIAISAGGTTVWELAFMGVPAVLGIIAPNHAAQVNELHRSGVALSVGWMKDAGPEDLAREVDLLMGDPLMRSEMTMRGLHLVDGRGVERLLDCMKRTQWNL